MGATKNPEAKRLNEKYVKHTENHIKDAVYNWIIARYSKHDNEFTTSDSVIWQGAVYTLPEIFGYIAFFAMFYWLGGIVYEKYGSARLFMFFCLLILWRLNILIKLFRKLDKDLNKVK